MMKKILVASALLSASAAFAAGAPDLTGQWNVHASISGNESDRVCTFVETDNKLTGTCTSSDEGKEVQITGNVDGQKLTWKYDAEYNGAPITLTYTATLDDSGKIAGNVEVDPYGVSGDFTATPKPAAAK